MSTTEQPSETLSDEERAIRSLRGKLADSSAVANVDLRTDRYPERLSVDLATKSIPTGVHDLIDEFDAEIDDARVVDSGLHLTVMVRASFSYEATFPIRKHGNSYVLTLHRDALETSGFEYGDDIDILARNNEIRLRPN